MSYKCCRRGQTKDPLYTTWAGMIGRCTVKSNSCYAKYGARGIKVCNRWLGKDGFFNFKNDMGAKPSEEYTLDRIDSKGDYSPNNCRWANKYLQAVNKQNVGEHRGVTRHRLGGYDARIQKDKKVYAKHFRTLEEAVAFRASMEKRLGITY